MADIGDPGDEESLSPGMERAAGQRASQHHSRTRKKKGTGKKHKPHHAKRPAEHRASVGAGSARGGVPRTPPRGRTGEPLIDLVAGSHSHGGGGRVSAGLGGVLLELASEGAIRAGAVLDAWQREQDRLTNRAWRRPGGLVRMGGL